jgi:aminoacrylate peracid reductase
MAKRVIHCKSLPEPTAPYSMATMSGNTMYISGLVALDKQGELMGKGDIVAQTHRVLEIMRELVGVEGGQLTDVTKTTVYLTNFENYAGMNKVYREFFPAEPPARATVKSELVNPGFLVEIDAIAVIDRA